MAVFVDISNTTHLTFSPLNEKHNILYHRARHNVNERHVQKPWFDLNPFLDKVDDKGLKLDDYRPENDTVIQPLESLAIVEDYFSDKPLMAKEFKIGDFWDFLFSHEWGDGYSVRVLEGRLYNLMMAILVNLTRAQSVVQHSTVAYAKNRRQKFSIYKHSEKEPELGSHEETLLLEFVYYGHSIRMLTETSSCGYPKLTEYSTMAFTTGLSSELESSEPDATIPSKMSAIHSQHFERTSSSCTADNSSTHSHCLLKKGTSSRITSDSTVFTKPLIDKSLSRIQGTRSAFRSQFSGIHRNLTISNFSSGSEEYGKPLMHAVDLTKFTCTEKVSYLGEFDLSDDSSYSSGDEDECTDYGQQFYLGERRNGRGTNLSTEEMLRARKAEYRKRWQKWKNDLRNRNSGQKPLFPEFSELDVGKYLTEDQNKSPDIPKLPDEIPDLMKFIDILQREEKQELAKKRNESRWKNPRKRCSMIKPSNERFADEVGGVTDSQACRLHCYQKDSSWKIMSETGRKKFLMEKALKFSGKTKEKVKRKAKQPKVKRRQLEIPFLYVTTPSGITYLHPASRELMNKKLKEKREVQSTSPTRRRMSLVPNTTPLGQELLKSRQQGNSRPTSSSLEEKSDDKPAAPYFPKARIIVSGMESPDFDSDDESDGLDDSPFNSTKLNVKYSLERIRKKKAQKKRDNPVQQSIFKILKKYYRMQSILKAFSGPTPPSRRKSSASGSRGSISSLLPRKRPPPRRRRNTQLPTIEDEFRKPKVDVGKLRWFPFLDAKRELHPPCDDDVEEPLFENYSMEMFRENLEKALDEFVVRREVVISDYTAKASVSITFTKKYVFSKNQNA